MVDGKSLPGGADLVQPVRVVNASGQGPFFLVADHASNRIPARWGDLGLPPSERVRHIAWDPGALAVSLRLTELLDAPLVHPTVSRLVIDCNRDLDATDLIPKISEYTEIPGNRDLTDEDRAHRIAASHAPFHETVTRLMSERLSQGRETILVCMHSFTPVFKGTSRPWPIGLIPARDETFTRALDATLKSETTDMNIGWNEPYSSLNGVTYTLEHHGEGLDATMIEIRHDEILEPGGVEEWASLLARCLESARHRLRTGASDTVSNANRSSEPGGLNG